MLPKLQACRCHIPVVPAIAALVQAWSLLDLWTNLSQVF
jgi:hypothetical protein